MRVVHVPSVRVLCETIELDRAKIIPDMSLVTQRRCYCAVEDASLFARVGGAVAFGSEYGHTS